MEEIYVVVTMDCERPRSETHATATGPETYEESDAFIRAYAEIADRHGFPVSFFVHPEVALRQGALFQELERSGSCLGLHIHPWKFLDGRYKAHFGGLSAARQRAILSEAIALWVNSFGRPPLYFRPGTFSANDSTFPVLADLGLRGGSASVPERGFRGDASEPDGKNWAEMNAIWTDAVPDPHRAHAAFRQLEGDLNFVEMPVSVDFSGTVKTGGRWFHWDLRPDWPEADYKSIATNIITQVRARNPAVPVINMGTHNDNDYTDPNDRVCVNFRTALQEIANACEAVGVRAVGTTMDRICDMVLAGPARNEQFSYR